MIRGMVQAYDDPYTVFVEPVQHELESNALQGSFGGVGVRLSRNDAGEVILYPFVDSPASKAGVQEGDRLIAADDLIVTPETTIDAIQAALRGKVGDTVRMTVARAPDFVQQELRVTRAEIPLPSVTWHLDVDVPELGVIEVNLIAASTAGEIGRAIADLQQRGAVFYALDLRNNSGGLLDSGVEIARLFLKSGDILQYQYRNQDVETYRADKPGQYSDLPLVVLVNENTASAAEIVAGALMVNQRAQIIGVPTFGKDTIQLVFDLDDGSSIHVTAARWWVPGLEPAVGAGGLLPDVLLNGQDAATQGDVYIRAAVEVLQKERK